MTTDEPGCIARDYAGVRGLRALPDKIARRPIARPVSMSIASHLDAIHSFCNAPSRAKHDIARSSWYYLTKLYTVLRRRTTPQMASGSGTQPPPPLDLDVLIQVSMTEHCCMSQGMLTSIRACLHVNDVEIAGVVAIHCCPSAGNPLFYGFANAPHLHQQTMHQGRGRMHVLRPWT
jgi:hypothetical protein